MFHDCGEQLPSVTYGRPSVDQLDAGIGVVPIFAHSNMRTHGVSGYSTMGLLADEDGIDQ